MQRTASGRPIRASLAASMSARQASRFFRASLERAPARSCPLMFPPLRPLDAPDGQEPVRDRAEVGLHFVEAVPPSSGSAMPRCVSQLPLPQLRQKRSNAVAAFARGSWCVSLRRRSLASGPLAGSPGIQIRRLPGGCAWVVCAKGDRPPPRPPGGTGAVGNGSSPTSENRRLLRPTDSPPVGCNQTVGAGDRANNLSLGRPMRCCRLRRGEQDQPDWLSACWSTATDAVSPTGWCRRGTVGGAATTFEVFVRPTATRSRSICPSRGCRDEGVVSERPAAVGWSCQRGSGVPYATSGVVCGQSDHDAPDSNDDYSVAGR